MLAHGPPLVRVKPEDLAAAGVERVPRVAGVQDGRPVLEDGRVLDVANVIWCTGFDPGSRWIDLPGVATTATRAPSAASSTASPACTSSACSSCTRCRRR